MTSLQRPAALRRLLLVLLVLVVLAVGACRAGSSGSCQVDADCATGATCEDGLCVAGETGPVAAFSAPATVALGAVVTLDAGASRASDGTANGLAYRWTVVSPEGVTLEAGTGATPTLFADRPHAAYVVRLVVAEGERESAAVEHTIQVENTPPVARLVATPETFATSSTHALDATTSTDADGDTLTYAWRFEQVPATAGGTFDGRADGTGTLQTSAQEAAYTVWVDVSDGATTTAASVFGDAAFPAPTVSAGAAQTVAHACTVAAGTKTCTATGSLTGTATDAGGGVDPATAQWRLVSSPPAAQVTATFAAEGASPLSTRFTLSSTATAPLAGAYEFELQVRNTSGTTGRSTVTVSVGNQPPTVSFGSPTPLAVGHAYDAQRDVFVVEAEVTALQGDADGDDLVRTYLPGTSTVTGVVATLAVVAETARYRFEVPRAAATQLLGTAAALLVGVRVTDVNGAETTSVLPLTVTDRVPVLLPSADLLLEGHTYGTVTTGPGTLVPNVYYAAVPISATDPDGDPLTLTWTLTTSRNVTLVSNGGTAADTIGEVLIASADPAVVTEQTTLTVIATTQFGERRQVVGVRLGNRKPVLSSPAWGPLTPTGGTNVSICTDGCFLGGCLAPASARSFTPSGNLGAFMPAVTAAALDGDNDPVTLTWRSAGAKNGLLVGLTAVSSVASPAVSQGSRTGPATPFQVGVVGTCTQPNTTATLPATFTLSVTASDGFPLPPGEVPDVQQAEYTIP